MEGISALSQQYGFKIVEDASHAIGGRYKGGPVGNCEYSDIVVFSFHPVKIVTTGEGGMLLTNSTQLADRIRLLRSHGITNKPDDMVSAPEHEIWNYQQIDLGCNYRLTDIQAALGITQMVRIDEFVSKRNALALHYKKALADLPVTLQSGLTDSLSSFHLFIIRLDSVAITNSHKEVYDAMRQCGIGVNLHYIPVYLQPYYEKQGFNRGYCREAERYFSEAISLPMYPTITDDELGQTIDSLHTILN
jgi:dTDP-4-amino-4,6-dideoxygalactose transaminase